MEGAMKEWLLVLKAADAAARWHVHQRRKKSGQSRQALHHSFAGIATGSTHPRGHAEHTMDKQEYLEALKMLELSPASKTTSQAIGYCVRSCIRFA
jgi:hypothetical protein